ncbi:single-stranded DNA-binding protein [Lactococcus lactis]|uniref:single-stranded DNA-binding protein n=1 Tax=Lactococcus lactis TaxID=1358 RepID=UPI0003B8D372|nr:single-stranded DNA-binding protein [Lactococcus lactis]MCT0077276.1 single-stranded DNA-binding protein [Lactococcus lactis subsp. lactis]MDM7659946.1 single-stranded DNA-binding protein [Lactococcus lactis]QLF90159.1 single-stranded DNA-binding protein [Lactococcus lactis subsp. lactis]UPS10167.1 Single-stranded DNA-binding protein [Lactococcus lactis]CDI46385.1 Single-stranded DNA-binding protein [Lactococcus lactis subsp. lactis Dephy 1]
MINNVVLVGRLTRDPELRYTPQNQAVGTFGLAVNRQFKNANGEREADFINCVIWRQQAENLAKFAKKGALIGITGRIQTRNYENQQGQKVYVTEVVADTFQMLESNKTQGQQTSKPQAQNKKLQAPDPFKAPAADPFAGGTEISDDQLPF